MTPPPLRPHILLLAEDNPDHAFFTTRAFHDVCGDTLEMRTVTDGEQLLDYLNQRGEYTDAPRPNLIVLDLKMPKKGGLEVLAEMRHQADLCTIPVVILSSSDRTEDINASYARGARGANSYITKPAGRAGLRKGVSELARYWLDVASLPGPD